MNIDLIYGSLSLLIVLLVKYKLVPKSKDGFREEESKIIPVTSTLCTILEKAMLFFALYCLIPLTTPLLVYVSLLVIASDVQNYLLRNTTYLVYFWEDL